MKPSRKNTILLIDKKILPSPLLYLSAFFEATRDQYYKHLYNVSALGSWTDWFMYFLNGVALQAEDVLSRAERINTLLNDWQIIIGKKSSSLPLDIIKNLAVNPFVTVKKIAHDFEVAFTTAQRAITKLENNRILTQTTSQKRERMYCAKQILEILEEPTHINTFLKA